MVRMIYRLIYGRSLFQIVLTIIACVLGWFLAASFMEKHGRKAIWVWVNRAAMLTVLAAVAGVTLWFRSETVSEVILTPFYSFVEAKTEPEIYRSMLMNVFLFVPLGLTMPFALPSKWKHRRLITIIFAFLLSGGIEFLQYRYSLGRCEVDDVICNTLGAVIGTLQFNR